MEAEGTHHVELGEYSLKIDGTEYAAAISSVRITADPKLGPRPKVTVELPTLGTTILGPVEVDSVTRDLLKRIGWTEPGKP